LEKINIFQNKPSKNELKYDLDLMKLISPDEVTWLGWSLKRTKTLLESTGPQQSLSMYQNGLGAPHSPYKQSVLQLSGNNFLALDHPFKQLKSRTTGSKYFLDCFRTLGPLNS
jgi:hypothetical protein